jgi:hypothetical protein
VLEPIGEICRFLLQVFLRHLGESGTRDPIRLEEHRDEPACLLSFDGEGFHQVDRVLATVDHDDVTGMDRERGRDDPAGERRKLVRGGRGGTFVG